MVSRGSKQWAVLGLDAVQIALLAAIPVLSVWFWWTWPKPPSPSSQVVEESIPLATPPTTHELAWYAPLWERDLKQPPIPPAAPPQAAPSAPIQLPVLLATLVEPQGRYAHFQGRSGAAEMKGLNETIDRFKVRAIEPGRVQLESDAGLVWVQIPKSGGGS